MSSPGEAYPRSHVRVRLLTSRSCRIGWWTRIRVRWRAPAGDETQVLLALEQVAGGPAPVQPTR